VFKTQSFTDICPVDAVIFECTNIITRTNEKHYRRFDLFLNRTYKGISNI
jgi:hypothetical protein